MFVSISAHGVSGKVKWFNVKNGYGFINRCDIKAKRGLRHSIYVVVSAVYGYNTSKLMYNLLLYADSKYLNLFGRTLQVFKIKITNLANMTLLLTITLNMSTL